MKNLLKKPIPKNAKMVFKGVIFEVYQWQQKMFDGSYRTFERLKRNDSVIIIPVTEDGKFILNLEKQPHIKPFTNTPGGQVDDGEKPLAAAKRELLEETGYKAGKIKLIKSIHPSGSVDWDIYVYLATGCKKVNEPKLDPGEKIKVKLLSKEQFLEAIKDRKFRNREIFAMISSSLDFLSRDF